MQNKRMRRALSILLCLCMVLSMMPGIPLVVMATGEAENTVILDITNGAVTITADGYTQAGVTTAHTGSYILTGTLSGSTNITVSGITEGESITLKDLTLSTTLTALNLQADVPLIATGKITLSAPTGIGSSSGITITGDADISITSNARPAIIASGAVDITCNSLTVSSTNIAVQKTVTMFTVNAVQDISVKASQYGIYCPANLTAGGNITVSGGTGAAVNGALTAKAGGDITLSVTGSAPGVVNSDAVLEAGGDISITAKTYAVSGSLSADAKNITVSNSTTTPVVKGNLTLNAANNITLGTSGSKFATGTTAMTYCGVLSQTTKTGTVTAEGEHTYENGICTGCGEPCPHADCVNGFCTVCGGYEKPQVDPGEYEEEWDDTYLIYNAGQLYWFAEYVNSVNNGAQARLMADIDLNPGYTFYADGTYTGGDSPRAWTPIGEYSNYTAYCGNFDGNGFTVSGVYCVSDRSFVGLFGYTDYNYVIEELCLTNSYIRGASHAGGLIGCAYTILKNCCVTDTVYVSGDSNVGGLVGYNGGEVSNCYAANGALAGYNYGTFTNCYFLSDTEDEFDGTTAKSAAQFASGEVAYLLQSGIVGEDLYDEEWNWIGTAEPEQIWGQTVGTDALPTLGGEKVYYGYPDCGSENAVYTNDSNASDVRPDHAFDPVTGLCPCGVQAVAAVSKNGTVTGYFTALDDAISAVSDAVESDNAVVTLMQDIVRESSLQIRSGVFTLDLNGRTLSGNGSYVMDIAYSTVIIADSGTTGAIKGSTKTSGLIIHFSTVTITGGTISAGYSGVDVFGGSYVTIAGGSISGVEWDIGGNADIMLTVGEDGLGATFPGGITCDDNVMLNSILGEGVGYWLNDNYVTVADDAYELTGGDVTVKACLPNTWLSYSYEIYDNLPTHFVRDQYTGETWEEPCVYDSETGLCAFCGCELVLASLEGIYDSDGYFTGEIDWRYFAAGEVDYILSRGGSQQSVFLSDYTVNGDQTYYINGTLSALEGVTVTSDYHVTFTYPTTLEAIGDSWEGSGTFTVGCCDYIRSDGEWVLTAENHKSWSGATCVAPKTCTACGATEGDLDPNAHDYDENGVCVLCGRVDCPLWVQGIQVTDDNAADILGDLDDGATVTYDAATNTLTLNNASIRGSLVDNVLVGIYTLSGLNIELIGENVITTSDFEDGVCGIWVPMGDLTVSGSGSLTVAPGASQSETIAIVVDGSFEILGGNITAAPKSCDTYAGVICFGDLTVAEGAALTASPFIICIADQLLIDGTVNSVVVVQSDDAVLFAAFGTAALTAALESVFDVSECDEYVVISGAVLTVNEDMTLDMSNVTADLIVLEGSVVNNGTVILPDSYTYATIPANITGGTLVIGETTFTWNGSKYVCVTHVDGDGDRACDVCGDASYELWVQGIQVTSDNAVDVLGDLDDGATVTYDAATNTLTLNNANVLGAHLDVTANGIDFLGTYGILSAASLNIRLIGTNTVTGYDCEDNFNIGMYIYGEVTIEGDGSLDIRVGTALSGSQGILTSEDLHIKSGSVNVTTGNTNISIAVRSVSGKVIVDKDATLTAAGDPRGKFMGVGVNAAALEGEGNVNAIVLLVDPETFAESFAVYGTAVLAESISAFAEYVFTEGSVLTVNEGVSVDMSNVAADKIALDGTILNNGTVVLPDSYTYATIPANITGGTLVIGETTFIWSGSKYVCVTHVDADGDGYCDVCDALTQTPELRMVSVSLKGNIALKYYMWLPDAVLSDSSACMRFTMADGTVREVPVSDGVKTVLDGVTYYVFSCGVPAKEMTDDVICQFIYDGGSTQINSYNVQTYAKTILSGEYTDEVKELVTAMLHYGAAAQLHFGYRTDDLANAGLEAPDYSETTVEGFDADAGQGTELVKFYSASLILKSETTLRFFFTAPIAASYNGQALDVKERGSLFYVDVVGIAAKDLDENVTITINDGINTAEVSFNPMSYCQSVLNDTTGSFSAEMKDLVRALFLYNCAANIYFKET